MKLIFFTFAAWRSLLLFCWLPSCDMDGRMLASGMQDRGSGYAE